MPDDTTRDSRLYVEDMLRFALKVLSYTREFDQAKFLADEMAYDATLRNLELIGEAASKIPTEIRNQFPAIPWRMIVATRNRLIHGYLGIDNDTIWSIVQRDIPQLIAELQVLRFLPM